MRITAIVPAPMYMRSSLGAVGERCLPATERAKRSLGATGRTHSLLTPSRNE